MKTLLAILHVALVSTVLLPVYTVEWLDDRPRVRLPIPWRDIHTPHWSEAVPLEEALMAVEGRYYLRSVVAAGIPAFLALLNIPVLHWLKGYVGDRWRAYSCMLLGLISSSMTFQLLGRYGSGRGWGAYAIWSVSMLILAGGVAATARLKPIVEPLPVIRDA